MNYHDPKLKILNIMFACLSLAFVACADEDDSHDGKKQCSVPKTQPLPSSSSMQLSETLEPSLTKTTAFELIEVTMEEAPSARIRPSVTRHGDNVVVFGGCEISEQGKCTTLRSTGAVYNQATKTWKVMSTENAPAPRMDHTGIASGEFIYIWGGCVKATYTSRSQVACSEGTITGARYHVAEDRWEEVPSFMTQSYLAQRFEGTNLTTYEDKIFLHAYRDDRRRDRAYGTYDILSGEMTADQTDSPFLVYSSMASLDFWADWNDEEAAFNYGINTATLLDVTDNAFAAVDATKFKVTRLQAEIGLHPLMEGSKVLSFGKATRHKEPVDVDPTSTTVGDSTQKESLETVAYLHDLEAKTINMMAVQECNNLVNPKTETPYALSQGAMLGADALFYSSNNFTFFNMTTKTCESFGLADGQSVEERDVVAGIENGLFLWRTYAYQEEYNYDQGMDIDQNMVDHYPNHTNGCANTAPVTQQNGCDDVDHGYEDNSNFVNKPGGAQNDCVQDAVPTKMELAAEPAVQPVSQEVHEARSQAWMVIRK